MNQLDLARIILLLIGRPVSKVRLARLIYFVHKDLIRKKLLTPHDILYIRSPLGPIPDGYTTLAMESEDIIAQRNTSSSLSYATEDYTVSEQTLEAEATLLEQYREMLGVIEKTLKILRPYTTPELIRISHNEPSWLAHHNGEIYQISTQDLKITFPEQKPLHLKINLIPLNDKPKTEANKIGAMQAHLLRGMIADIVKESTDLEYPNDPATNAPPSTSRSLKDPKVPKTSIRWLQLPTIRLKISRKKPQAGQEKNTKNSLPSQNKSRVNKDSQPLHNEGENRTITERNYPPIKTGNDDIPNPLKQDHSDE